MSCFSSSANSSSVSSAVLEKEKEKATAGVSNLPFGTSAALDIVADVYHGFVFWSILTSLGVLVWYFPLWYMGISGYEAFVMSTVSPFLLGIAPLRKLVVQNLRIVHLLSLSGLLAFLVPGPVGRLSTVGFAVWMQCLAWAATFYADSVHEGRLESRIMAWMAGLLVSSIAKFMWQTNNPIWPIMHGPNGGWNYTALVLAVPAALRFTRRGVLSGGDSISRKDGSALLSALSIGGLMFGLHSLLSDSSTMILWVWEGYPIRGPTANTSAWYTIWAMTGGLLLGLFRPQVVNTYGFYAFGCVGATILTYSSHWFGYLGALITATFLMAISHPLITNAAKKSPAVTFGLGFFVYNFLVLFHVWVVAYAFVPGGPLVREHTDWVMLTTFLLIGAGFLDINRINSSKKAGKRPVRNNSSPKPHRRYHLSIIGVLNLLFLGAAFLRFPTNDYKPYHGDANLITAGIWTIHFSLDNDMWSSEVRMRNLIKELEIDVIGLLESDLQRIIMGNRDTTQYLAEDLGMYVDYGPGPNKHTWGAALLSKFPIVNSTHHLLPSPVGELAPAIHATLDAYGTLVDVFVFHSGQEEDPEDRRLQTEYLSKLMGSTDRPSILLSYLVTKPGEGNYNTYVSDVSGMHDIDPTDWDRWCEYILYKGLKRTGYARVSRSTITDTELQVGKFVVPRTEEEKSGFLAAEDDKRDRRVKEADIEESRRFPAMFRGKGVRGHKYHVFNEPRYYNF